MLLTNLYLFVAQSAQSYNRFNIHINITLAFSVVEAAIRYGMKFSNA